MDAAIVRSTASKNGVEEHRWHYVLDKLSLIGKIKVYLSVIYGCHLLLHGVLYFAPLYLPLLFGYISLQTFSISMILYFSTYLIYRPFECRNGVLPWYPKWYKQGSWWEYMKFYGDWLIIRRGPDSLYENKQFVYGLQPHGILACNRILMMGNIWFDEIQPGTMGRYAAAIPQFYTPGVRETTIWAAAVDASRHILNVVIKAGESVYLWVGGTKELMTTDPNSTDTKIVILDRYGFIKLAISHGIDIVPVCQFGEKWIFRMYTFPDWFGRILYKFKIPAILIFGRGGCTLMPYNVRPDGSHIRAGMVVDEPIRVKQVAYEKIDFDRDIKPIHEEYKKRMRYLFDTYKKDFLYSDEETMTFVSAKPKRL